MENNLLYIITLLLKDEIDTLENIDQVDNFLENTKCGFLLKELQKMPDIQIFFKKVILKTKSKGKYKGVCGWGTNKLTVGNHKVVIKPADIRYGGSKTVNMKIKKSAKKFPKWDTKV